MLMPLKFEVLPGGVLPTRGSPGAIGLDLYASIPGPNHFWVIPRGHRAVIMTGLKVAVPEGYYGRIAPRSGLAAKYGIDVLAGVIDPDYRGEIGVVLINHGENSFRVDNGERIAQFIVECADQMVPIAAKLDDDTERGEGGFGSTG
jgi:dUTP pyrophosphatase